MRRSEALDRLRDAFLALREEREDHGAGLAFKDVWSRAGVSRAVAYRAETGFRAEFEAAMAYLRGEHAGLANSVTGADTRSDLRALVAQLANQVQVLALELDRERRRNQSTATVDADINVLAFTRGRFSR